MMESEKGRRVDRDDIIREDRRIERGSRESSEERRVERDGKRRAGGGIMGGNGRMDEGQ